MPHNPVFIDPVLIRELEDKQHENKTKLENPTISIRAILEQIKNPK